MNNTYFDKVTIVIPTFNRRVYLRRILSYYQLYAPNINILVTDSSSDENKDVKMNTISSFNDLNISYNDDYPSMLNLFQKIASAAGQVKTKYCVVCADDDFITPNGIEHSVKFLENNADYTVAHGYYIQYEQDEIEQQRFVWVPYLACPSVTSPDAVERFRIHLLNYYPTFYGVHRTDFLRRIFDESQKYTDDVRFGELLPSMLSAIYGKLKCLDLLYGVRENSRRSVGYTGDRMSNFIKEGTYDYKYLRFRSCLVPHLLANSDLTESQAVKVCDDTMHMYFIIVPWRNRKEVEKMKALSIYDKLFLPTEKLKERLRSCLEDPSSKYYDDFDRIRKHVFLHQKYNNTAEDNRVPVC